ncbi:MAG: hypothetical protein U0V74_06675 [Chitinophagales bacterium]
MKALFYIAVMLLVGLRLSAEDVYRYSVDLQYVQKDMVKVSLLAPKLPQQQSLTFIIPRVVPGSYAIKDFGRFVTNFSAYTADGKKLKVKRSSKNTFVVSRPNELARIEYWVNDTWDDKNKKEYVFQPCGSNIEENANFVINGHCFFGYFDGFKMLPYEITVNKPDGFYGATPLQKKEETPTKDILLCPNYVELADNPVMYSKADTASFDVGNMNVLIAVYSAKGLVHSTKIVEYVQPIGNALKRFFKKLPVNNYLFIYYFDAPEKLQQSKAAGLSGGYGALEHHHCSFYYLPETTFEKELRSTVYHVSCHEFLHILTPLNIHSKEIENFDFLNPTMSSHLWMYEGVTEYFSLLCQVQDSLLTEDEFLDLVKQKIDESEQFGNFSFTDMSSNVLTQQNQKLYLSVYNKGAVLAMMLDINIQELTGGQKNLKSVLLELAGKYGPERPFDDKELIAEIVSRVDPKLQRFFDDYINGSKPLNYAPYFNLLGWNYEKDKERKVYISGYFGVEYKEENSAFALTQVKQNIFGFQNGDILEAVNDEEISADNFIDIFDRYFKYNDSPAKIKVRIMRGTQEMTLQNSPIEALISQKNYIVKDKAFTEQVNSFRSQFFAR